MDQRQVSHFKKIKNDSYIEIAVPYNGFQAGGFYRVTGKVVIPAYYYGGVMHSDLFVSLELDGGKVERVAMCFIKTPPEF